MCRKIFTIFMIIFWIASNAPASENGIALNIPSVDLNRAAEPNLSHEFCPFVIPGSQIGNFLISQAGADELSHPSLSADLTKKKDFFFFIDAGASIPIYDKTFRDFLDYGACLNIGAGKRISSDLTITTSIGVVMMNGKWSTKGDPRSLQAVSESWANTQTGEITAEENKATTGDSYLANGESFIKSSENLEKIDIDTTLYLFPLKVDALYQFNDIGRIKPYAGGGIGICLAQRSSESTSLKTKYFEGPEYTIKFEKDQSVTGMLVDLLLGFVVPFKNDMKIVGQVSTTFYDLDNFDPILEVTYEDVPLSNSDQTTFSYETPGKIGVFKNVFITNISIGLIIPF